VPDPDARAAGYGSAHLEAVVAHELAHHLLGHDALARASSPPADWQHVQEERELDANATAAEILVRVRGMPQAEAVQTVVSLLQAVQRAVDGGAAVAAGHRHHSHYAASKAGVIGFTRALAREVGPRGIHVNAIAPGPIETELIGPITEEFRREKTAIFALRRFGLPDEVAPTAVFLASDDSSYYAGQTLCPNGGDIMV
jgi:NAD(P)-dependent dehydrogenase (short-subunit alcohol dehydrogenase family)